MVPPVVQLYSLVISPVVTKEYSQVFYQCNQETLK